MRRVARWFAYWLVVLGALAFTGYAVVDSRRAVVVDRPSVRAAQPTTTASPGVAVAQPVALIVGDGLVRGVGSRRGGFAWRACAELGWTCRFDAVADSGYVTGRNYASRLPAIPGSGLGDGRIPDVVVVTGGAEDLGRQRVQPAAQAYFTGLTRAYPEAALVVVEPFWNDDDADAAIRRLRGDVRAAAGAAQATWVGSQGWVDTAMLAAGGELLTAAGHRALGASLATGLRAVELTP